MIKITKNTLMVAIDKKAAFCNTWKIKLIEIILKT